MHWPSSGTPARSATIQVNGARSIAAVTNKSPTSATSSASFTAPFANDDFLIKVWSGSSGSGSVLAHVRIAQRIVPGTVNVIGATIDAQFAKIGLGPAGAQPFVTERLSPTVPPPGNVEFIASGPLRERFIATPEDTTGNAIAFTRVSPLLTLSLSKPTARIATLGDNEFLLTPVPMTKPPVVTIKVVGTCILSPCATSKLFQISDAIFIASQMQLLAFDSFGNPIPLNGFSTIGNIHGIAYDPLNSRIYTTDIVDTTTGAATVHAYTVTGQPVATPGGFPGLQWSEGITVDTFSGNLYVATGSLLQAGTGVYQFDAAGNPVSTQGFAHPTLFCVSELAFDSHNADLYALVATVYIPYCETGSPSAFNEQGAPVATPGGFPNLPSNLNPDGGLTWQFTVDPHNATLYFATNASTPLFTISSDTENGTPVNTGNKFSYPCGLPDGIAYDPTFQEIQVIVELPVPIDCGPNSSSNLVPTMFIYDESGNLILGPPEGFQGIGNRINGAYHHIAIVPP